MARFSIYTLLAYAATFAGVQAGAQVPSNNLRIMALGASQTAGWGSTNLAGWHHPLAAQLRSEGKTVELVGTQKFDGDWTEAYPGYTITGVYDASLKSDAYSSKPNVIIATIGTNNCIQGSSTPYVDGLVQMGPLLLNIHENLPETLTLVAGVVKWKGDTPARNCIATLNSGIQQAVAEAQAYGQNVQYVDLYDVLDLDTDYNSDGVHPTDAGYVKLTATWHNALQVFSSSINAVQS